MTSENRALLSSKEDDTEPPKHTIISASIIALFVIFAINILAIYITHPNYVLLTLIPLVFLLTREIYGSFKFMKAFLLVLVCEAYFNLTLFPLAWYLGKYSLLLAYGPVFFVALTFPQKNQSSWIFLRTQTYFWDIPLIFWMYVISLFGGRAVEVSIL